MLNRTIEHNTPIAPSELIITEEGKIYHLNLHPNDIADDIIVVGDQNRVKRISQHFDSIELEGRKQRVCYAYGNVSMESV